MLAGVRLPAPITQIPTRIELPKIILCHIWRYCSTSNSRQMHLIRPGLLISPWLCAQGINFPGLASDNIRTWHRNKKGPIPDVLCHLFGRLNGGANLCITEINNREQTREPISGSSLARQPSRTAVGQMTAARRPKFTAFWVIWHFGQHNRAEWDEAGGHCITG